MANEIITSGQFTVLVVLNNLASSIAKEGANVESVIQTLSKFRIQLERIIESCQPSWSRIDIADARIIWAAEPSAAKRVANALQKLECLRKQLGKWLLDEGFSELKFSVGMETGLVILGGQGALGVPVTTAYVFADYGLEQNSVIASEKIISLLNLNSKSLLDLVDIEMQGLSNKQRVVVLPLSEFVLRLV